MSQVTYCPYDRPGRYTVAVKVIDIFGNDTMTLVPVNVADAIPPGALPAISFADRSRCAAQAGEILQKLAGVATLKNRAGPTADNP